MADKQLLLKKNADDGFFADDDPLAELARIVSFEPPVEVPARPLATARREPEFNLEDELLKEFEQYEASERAELIDPEPEFPPFPIQQPNEPALEPETVAEVALEPEPVAAAVVPAAREAADPAPYLEVVAAAPEIVDPVKPASHPVFDLEEEIMREFAAFEARSDDPPASLQPVAGPDLVDQLIAELAPQTLAPEAAYVEPTDGESARYENAATQELQPLDEAYDQASSMDVAAGDSTPAGEEFIEEPVSLEADFSAEQGWDDVESATPGHYDAVVASVVADPVAAEPPSAVAPPAAAQSITEPTSHDHEFDELLNDVERYPVATPAMQWSRATPRIEPRVEQPVAPVEQSMPAEEEQVAEAVAEVVPEIHASDLAEVEETAAEIEAHEAFDEGAFELDMSEIELDLLEMETLTDSVAEQDAVEATPDSLQSIADVEVDAPKAEPVEKPEPVFFGIRPVDDYSSLPFDPTQIVADDEPVEAIAELDVPEVPQEHVAPAPAVHADYDIDIDAEMAHLFNRPAPAPVTRSQELGQTAASAVKPPPPAPQIPLTDLDDFERALEEDFRKSMTENRGVTGPDRVALSPAGYPIDANERGSSRRLVALAASVAAIVFIGGAGVYAFWGDGSSMLESVGEPKIILADKDPVKVVPEDKGGQQVPNQDKAVYDRVSGEKPETSKQERLVSSNEEPVDVVQRTLMPEGLPEDADGMPNITPTDDTTDPRLLSEDAENVSTSEKVTSGVAPRKVRTMVVRPDGTLVPREELAEEEQSTRAAAEAQPRERAVEVAKAETEVPERLTASESATDSIASQIRADDAVEPVPQEKAAEPVVEKSIVAQPEAVEEKPIVAEEPATETPVAAEEKPAAADQPVAAEQPALATENAAEADAQSLTAQENTAEAEMPVAEQTAEATRSALADAATAEVDAPVREVETVKIANENTPIPESRPVEQPVNVVGTVTDQGNVRQPDEEQQVAAADPVVQAEKPSVVPAGSYVIQIASLPSEADAQSSYSRLSAKYAGIIGGRGVDIKRAEIKNKGTYYRVRIPAGTKQEAASLCDRYKKAGGSCLVSK